MPAFEGVTKQELIALGPLQLAYIGDCVYELLVRGHLLKTLSKPKALHRASASQVNAGAQAQALRALEKHLNEDEKDYVRRGRNAQPRHALPKSATSADYAAATGLETLYGYLYVTGQEERLAQLFRLSMQASTDDAAKHENEEGIHR